MRAAALVALGLLAAACGPTLHEDLDRAQTFCSYDRLLPSWEERGCAAHRRAVIASHGETPTAAQESLWGFRALVAEKREAGAISPAEADFVARDYQRRLEGEARQLEAAQDSAQAARLGNYLTIWRAYFGDR